MGKFTEHHIYEDIKSHCFHIIFDLDDAGSIYQKENEWCEELFDQIPFFALGEKKALEKSKASPRKATREGMKLFYEVQENTDLNRRGEFGELLLFYLLEKKLHKKQLISKIYFKDTPNDTVHGFDTVHFDEKDNSLWIGESKFYTDKNQALSALARDLFKHFNKDLFEKEFIIISNRFADLNINNPQIKNLIDPDTQYISKLVNINACFFATFESLILDSFSFENGDKISESFLKEIAELTKECRIVFDKKTLGYPNKQHLKIHLLIFILKDKKTLVTKLQNKLQKEQ